jgi:hypothetical protein
MSEDRIPCLEEHFMMLLYGVIAEVECECQGVDERANHLADRAIDGSPGRVERPLVSVPDGCGFE